MVFRACKHGISRKANCPECATVKAVQGAAHARRLANWGSFRDWITVIVLLVALIVLCSTLISCKDRSHSYGGAQFLYREPVNCGWREHWLQPDGTEEIIFVYDGAWCR